MGRATRDLPPVPARFPVSFLLDFLPDRFDVFAAKYNEYGAWAVLDAGVTPFPFKIITILSGATGLGFGIFLIASTIARFGIFFLIAALLWKIGPPVREFIEKRLGLMAALFVVLLFGGFIAASYLA